MQLEADFDAVMAVFDNKAALRKSLKEGCAGVAILFTLSAGDGENCCFTRFVVLFSSAHAHSSFAILFLANMKMPAALPCRRLISSLSFLKGSLSY